MPQSILAILYVVLTMAGIAAVDVLAGREISLWVLYIFPVGAAAFLGGIRLGVLVALLAVAMLLWEASRVGYPNASYGYFVFTVASRTLAYLVVALLAGVVGMFVREMLGEMLGEDQEHGTTDTRTPIRSLLEALSGRRTT